ncbi:hypothetical protein NOVO_07595 [Rickettsiales bacterium Ac37b]|nr:hypothetical protein NOVO_07595 [Rickettsiales bacterium Ac37b]
MGSNKILRVSGKDFSGRVAEYYLSVNNIQYILLQKEVIQNKIFDISKFGKVIYSAYCENSM